MNDNRANTINKKTIYYKDIINYIKNDKKDTTKAKAETKIICQK